MYVCVSYISNRTTAQHSTAQEQEQKKKEQKVRTQEQSYLLLLINERHKTAHEDDVLLSSRNPIPRNVETWIRFPVSFENEMYVKNKKSIEGTARSAEASSKYEPTTS